jgi:hypothetical protein
MRTRNALERLAAAGRPLLAEAESLVEPDERERILERILASERRVAAVPSRRRTVLVLVLGAIVAAAIAVVSIGVFTRSSRTGGHHPFALTGPTIELAGYHFRTPAGFKAASSCQAPPTGTGPTTVLNGFAAAASADGCVEAAVLIHAGARPAGAEPVDVGQYQAYYASPDSSGESTLYVELPNAGGDGGPAYVVLFARGLTEDQLVAVAASGLPG